MEISPKKIVDVSVEHIYLFYLALSQKYVGFIVMVLMSFVMSGAGLCRCGFYTSNIQYKYVLYATLVIIVVYYCNCNTFKYTYTEI